MKNKLIYYFLLGVLSFIVISILYVLFLLFKPFTPPTIFPDPIPILNANKIVHYGEPIQTKVTGCTFESVPATVSVKYQNAEGRVYFFASHDSKSPVGCRESQQNRDPIPASLPAGKYIIYVTAVFHITPLEDITKVYQTETFELVATPSANVK